MAVSIGAGRISALGANAIAEESIHPTLIEADTVVKNRKNVLCVFVQGISDPAND